ncbi:hypothetical protein T265_07280 [Opisthorchis viverrini]|uniref:Uncharacterized protein n=1 Tax=Opisthorchis viverrini TaxID=6198 RepID=A0A074ZDJ4_OPIVI|nr:hypothetical protein T265_07280 [Opisthorchis viverrini]KER25243.1 hypothetical protein T265_07280 [Opisthorchis viverrini]
MDPMNVRPTKLDSDQKPEEDTDSSGEKDESLLLLIQRAKRSSQSSDNKESEHNNADTSDENEAKLEEKPEPRSSVSATRRPSAISISDYLASKAVQQTIEAQRHNKKSLRRSSAPSKSSGRTDLATSSAVPRPRSTHAKTPYTETSVILYALRTAETARWTTYDFVEGRESE